MTPSIPSNTEVVVIGGGPAGSTAATLIAEQGRRVTLFEREHFPRFHIGESLIPETYWVLQRLKLIEPLKHGHFVKKYSVQFITEHGKLSEPFYFWDHKPYESSQTWQVRRDEFDTILLNNARQKGADVHEGVRVLNVIFDGNKAKGVRIKTTNGQEKDVMCQVVVDASGMSTVLMDRLQLRQWDPDLKKAAVWTYWKGAKRDQGRDEGATLVIQTEGKRGWFWYIPLHDDVVSVGVVSSEQDLFKEQGSKDLEKIYFDQVAKCPGLQPRLQGATRCDIFRAQKEYSYRARQIAGDGWVLVGDALGFLDPLYSSGVLLALVSGAKAADAVVEGLSKHDVSARQLGCWSEEYIKGMNRMRRLVCEFYNGFSFGQFIRRHPHLKGYITDMLIGDLYKDELDQLWPLMDAMRAELSSEQATMLESATA